MTDPGLDRRLRQRSRRAGFMIGITMALTIAVCVAGFSVIYAALDDTIGDFVSRDVPAPVIPTTTPGGNIVQTESEPESSGSQPTEVGGNSTEEPAEAQPTTEPTPEADGAFQPDYLSSELGLNFRTEPSTSGGNSTVIQVLSGETPLEFTGDTQPSDDPNDGEDGWMLFRIEDGTEGWLRALDVTETDP